MYVMQCAGGYVCPCDYKTRFPWVYSLGKLKKSWLGMLYWGSEVSNVRQIGVFWPANAPWSVYYQDLVHLHAKASRFAVGVKSFLGWVLGNFGQSPNFAGEKTAEGLALSSSLVCKVERNM